MRVLRHVLIGVALLAGVQTLSAQRRPPNILVIVADDLGYGDIVPYGAKDIPTPNLSALAASGVRFTDAYVSGPYCSPTRAGLLTGRYPQRFGHEFNIGIVEQHRDVGLPLGQATMADRFRAAGYRTALIGKWHLGSAPRFHPMRRGFDEFFGFLPGSHSYVSATPGVNPIYDGEEIVPAIPYLTDTLSARAVEFVNRNRARPFFLYLAFNAVHAPVQATDQYVARVSHITDPTRRTYAAMLVAMDDAIGRTLAAVRAAGLDDNTLVFFFSDNGGPIDAQEWNGSSNAPLRGDKGQTWEGGIRVPFVMRWPGHLRAGVTESRPIIQLDVLPTALAAAGLAVPQDSLDGVNLLPFLTGRNSGAPHETLFWRAGWNMAVRHGDWKLAKTVLGGTTYDPATLTLSGAELFNIRSDISESTDLASRNPERVRELSALWQKWRQELAVPAWPPPQGYAGATFACLDERFAAQPVSAYSGRWRGMIGGAASWMWSMAADGTGQFAIGVDSNSAPTRVVYASLDSLVFETTEPIRPREGPKDLMVRIVMQRCDELVNGFVTMQRPDGSSQRIRVSGRKQ